MQGKPNDPSNNGEKPPISPCAHGDAGYIDPESENIPKPKSTATTSIIGQEWGWMGIDH